MRAETAGARRNPKKNRDLPCRGRARRPPPLSLRAPRPKSLPDRPHGLKPCARPTPWRPARPEAHPCRSLPGIGAVRTGSERRIRGLWSVDANRLRRARARTEAQRERLTYPGNGHGACAARLRGLSAHARHGRAADIRSRWEGRLSVQAGAADLWGGVTKQLMVVAKRSYCFLRKTSQTRGQKCRTLALSQVLVRK